MKKMKSVEIIRMWNEKMRTKFPKTDTASIKIRIDELINQFGEKIINDYFYEMTEKGNSDIWSFAVAYKVKDWSSKKNPELNALELLGNQLVQIMGNDLANRITDKVKDEMNQYILNKTINKVYEYKDEKRQVNGIAHNKLDTIIKFIAMDEPVMMVGNAGTGKNVIAKQVAEALGLEFYFSNAVTQEYKITGYGDANGNFVETQFYKAFKNGGLFLLDEIDASCPEALVVMNCAIANGYFDFPVIGKVEANENFRIIARANTFGTGASMEYVGRNQLDAATLNRFAIVEVDYDERIENLLCPNEELAMFLRDFRKTCAINGVNHIVSYREFNRLYKMIEVAKMEPREAIKCCLTKGLEVDTLRMLKNNMSSNKYNAELTY